MNNQATIASAAQILGSPVEDAVFVSRRPRSFFVICGAGGVIGGLIGLGALKGGILGDAVLGACVGLGFAFAQQPRIIAKSGLRLALLSSSRWRARATELVGELNGEDIQPTGKGLIGKVVMISGDKHVVAKPFVARLATMLGRPV